MVLDKDSVPQPNEVAVIITVPEKPVVHETRPVTLLIFPANSLFHDQVTESLDINWVVCPASALGQL